MSKSSPSVITIYKNGDNHFLGKKIVVNRREVRTFDCFLDKVTKATGSKEAIRKVHSANSGNRIGSLEEIRNGGNYVAAGIERYIQLPYQHIRDDSRNMSKPISLDVTPVSHSRVIVSSRCRKEAQAEGLKNRIIFVYSNGKEKDPPMKLLLDKRILQDIETVLQYISNKISLQSGACRAMFTTDGVKINDVGEIVTNTSYVAVGAERHFIKKNYSMHQIPMVNTRVSPKYKVLVAAREKRGKDGYAAKRDAMLEKTNGANRNQGDGKPENGSESNASSVEPEERNGLNWNGNKEYNTGINVKQAEVIDFQNRFFARKNSIVDNHSKVVPPIKRKEDPTPYKATGNQSERADEITENGETRVEPTIDMLNVNEVEEEIESENNTMDMKNRDEDVEEEEDMDYTEISNTEQFALAMQNNLNENDDQGSNNTFVYDQNDNENNNTSSFDNSRFNTDNGHMNVDYEEVRAYSAKQVENAVMSASKKIEQFDH